jgi:peptidoglycan/LPS O-acetylase OafA/YrhL
VLIFHAVPSSLRGGFTGVDVFFVLSGYLITSIILHDLRDGGFSLRGFYPRRIQRLLSNYYLIRYAGGYRGDSAASFPLLHTWSLALDEQFYLLFPTALWLIARRRPNSCMPTPTISPKQARRFCISPSRTRSSRPAVSLLDRTNREPAHVGAS